MTGRGIDALDRVCVKIPARGPYGIEDEAAVFVPVFHEWIRDRALDLVLLDVADYAHVPDGPGIMLICHEVNFALDRADGTFGLLAQRRVPFEGPAAEAVAVTLRQLLEVAARLESDDRIAGKLALDASRIRIEANDRLVAPNTRDGYEAFVPVVEEGLGVVFGGDAIGVTRVDNDPRDRLAVEVTVETSPDVQDHVRALTGTPPNGSV